MDDDLNPLRDIFSEFGTPPNEDDEHKGHSSQGWSESRDEDGKLTVTVHPSLQARASAATLAGFFIALQDAGFEREEAFTLVRTSISDVVIVGDHDDDE